MNTQNTQRILNEINTVGGTLTVKHLEKVKRPRIIFTITNTEHICKSTDNFSRGSNYKHNNMNIIAQDKAFKIINKFNVNMNTLKYK